MADGTLTEKVWAKRELGFQWLGPAASLEEYAVAWWMQEHGIQYVYQMPLPEIELSYAVNFHVDFLIIARTPPLVIEVQGDKWHLGADHILEDRQRALIIESIGWAVVAVWSHDILQEPGYPPPTDESFNRVMEAAVRGHQIGEPII